jgi:hypothetical protein
MHNETLARIPWTHRPSRNLSVQELPVPQITRWNPQRKAEVILAISSGLISAEAACLRYQITPEELSVWQSAYLRYGIGGLKAPIWRRNPTCGIRKCRGQ